MIDKKISKIIKSRRTTYPRDFNGANIKKEVIEEILDNANQAPSHRMTQPWFFKIFTNERKNDLANAIYQKLESGSDLSTLAGKYELVRDQEVSRNSSNIPPALIEEVLSTNIGSLTKPFYDFDSNSFVVVKVTSKEMLELNKFETQQIDMEVAKDLNSTINNSLFESYLKYLRNKTEIVINVGEQQ